MNWFAFVFSILMVGCSGISATDSSDNSSVVPEADSVITSSPLSTTFIYRVAQSSDAVYRASIDTTTGEIAEHAAFPLLSADDPSSLAVSLNKKFLFVGNAGTKKIQTYDLNQVTGALTFASSHLTTLAPVKLLADPTGKFLYSLESDWIEVFQIDANGELTWVEAEPIVGGGRDIAIDPTGKYLYKSSTSTGIDSYDIGATGALTVSGIRFVNAATSFEVNPAGTRLYGPSYGSSDVLLFTINVSTGILTFNNYLSTGRIFPHYDLVFNSAGSNLYMLNQYLGFVDSYSVNAGTGAITRIGSRSLPSGCNPNSMAMQAAGSFIFTGCMNNSGRTYSYKVESDGSLTEAAHSKITNLNVNSIVTVTF